MIAQSRVRRDEHNAGSLVSEAYLKRERTHALPEDRRRSIAFLQRLGRGASGGVDPRLAAQQRYVVGSVALPGGEGAARHRLQSARFRAVGAALERLQL